MQTIDNFNFAGKKAFVRVDFNVPLDENFNITDDTRMRAALPTLKKILADGGSVIIGSHLGRPKGATDKFSLKHILKHLSELLGVDVQFANDCIGEEAGAKAAALQPGEALLLENLRFYAEEEGKPFRRTVKLLCSDGLYHAGVLCSLVLTQQECVPK